MDKTKTAKYEYLNDPYLLENFKNTYLASLNVFLNDSKFSQKVATLPALKSSTITKYEKLIHKEEQEKLKRDLKKKKTSTDMKDLNLKSSLKKNKSPENKKNVVKGITARYIIIDHELVEITLQAIEESNEVNSKLTDPFNAYFHENNEKIRRKALDQIISSIIPKSIINKGLDNNNNENNNNNNENNNNNNNNNNNENNNENKDVNNIEKDNIFTNTANTILLHDLKALEEKYKLYDEEQKKRDEKYGPVLKVFNENCENHNIITLDQKIDYFFYLYENNGIINPNKNKTTVRDPNQKRKNTMYKKMHSSIKGGNTENTLSKINNANLDIGTKYINELKNNNFKISDEIYYNDNLENYESDLETKIKGFDFIKKNFESSTKFIDKLRMYLRCQEISPEKIIIRECELNSERFLYLITKKYFDFGILRHLNLSRNNLGDYGGSCLLTLIKSFGIKFDYLNLSYNKLGKQSIEVLIDILQENNVKIISLSLGGNNLGDKLFSEFCIGISKNSFLQKLFVHDNELGKIASVILGTILKYDKKLKLLDVSKNDFGDENIGYMLKGLICNTTLKILMLNDMNLTNKSLRVFETTLCINTTLKELFLERNKLSHKGWKILSEVLNKNKYIEFVSLVGNNFEQEHFNLIADQQRQVKLRVISKTDYFLQISSMNENVNFYEYLY